MCVCTVCVHSFCPLTCITTLENCSLVCADVALTTSEAPETVQLLHTDSHLGRVWRRLGCEHVHTQTPTHSQARCKSPYTSIHIEDISTFPKNAYLSEVQLFLFRGLVVARDLLFQFCKMWTDFKEKRGTFPEERGRINTPTSLSSTLFFSFFSPLHLLLPIRLHRCLSAVRLTHLAGDQQCG